MEVSKTRKRLLRDLMVGMFESRNSPAGAGREVYPEGPQMRRKGGRGPRFLKTGQTGGRSGSLGYQTCNLGADGSLITRIKA